MIFMVEDATTILIWFLTGTFDFSNAAYANLYLTVGSGCVAAIGVAYPMVSAIFIDKDGCTLLPLSPRFPTFLNIGGGSDARA